MAGTVSDASSKDEQLSRLKAEYEEVVAKMSKEPNDGTDPCCGPTTGSDGHGSEDEFEEITVIENWMRFFKANAELLVLYGVIEVTNCAPVLVIPFASPVCACNVLWVAAQVFALPYFADSTEDTQIARLLMIAILWQVVRKK